MGQGPDDKKTSVEKKHVEETSSSVEELLKEKEECGDVTEKKNKIDFGTIRCDDTLFSMVSFFLIFVVLTSPPVVSIASKWLSSGRYRLVLGAVGSVLILFALRLKEKYLTGS